MFLKRPEFSPRFQKTAVFQMDHNRVHVSYKYIEELNWAAARLNLKDRENYFASNGVNYINVVRFYRYVLTLEELYKNTKLD